MGWYLEVKIWGNNWAWMRSWQWRLHGGTGAFMRGWTGQSFLSLPCEGTVKRLYVNQEKEGLHQASQVALVVKKLPARAGDIADAGSILGSGRSPGVRNGNPLQYSCLENPQGQRSLVGYSPGGHKELDTTERLHFMFISPDIVSTDLFFSHKGSIWGC